MLDMDKFGQLIMDKRKKAGLTQESFAARLGITPQAVSKWENGLTFPDVTLFPMIAQILDVPIATLFGEKEPPLTKAFVAKFEDTYRGLPLVYKSENSACYSAKAVMKIDEEARTVYFTDGSYGDLSSRTVKNCGAGEIYIKKAEKYDCNDGIDENTPNEISEFLEKFDTVRVSVACSCDVYINEGKERKLSAKGSKRFIASLKYRIENKELLVEMRPKNDRSFGGENRIDIWMDISKGKGIYTVVNGSALCRCQPSFEHASISINGSGDFALSEVDELRATVNGSGNIKIDRVHKNSHMTVNGSGDISVNTARDTHLSVNGAGDMNVNNAEGELHIKVAGAGDVKAGGHVDKLCCRISGSGDIKCEDLSADEAEIYAENSSRVHIGRIVKSSVEKIGDQAELRVDKRG